MYIYTAFTLSMFVVLKLLTVPKHGYKIGESGTSAIE